MTAPELPGHPAAEHERLTAAIFGVEGGLIASSRQIRKNERSSNRIGSSCLFEFAKGPRCAGVFFSRDATYGQRRYCVTWSDLPALGCVDTYRNQRTIAARVTTAR
jgi:hypothetical protein